jgi:hypothetical protein
VKKNFFEKLCERTIPVKEDVNFCLFNSFRIRIANPDPKNNADQCGFGTKATMIAANIATQSPQIL